MATKKQDDKPAGALIDELEKHLTKLLNDTMKSPEATLTDKTKVADRVLKLVQIKAKLDEDEWGNGFSDDAT